MSENACREQDFEAASGALVNFLEALREAGGPNQAS
jgi:hypothetical protein